MKKKFIFILGLFFLIFFLNLISALDINSCQNLSVAGTTYNLTQNVNITGATCFNVNVSNITLDCGGFSVTGSNSSSTYGITTNAFNTTLRNCNVSNFTTAIYINGADNGTISNISAYSTASSGYGVYLNSQSNYNLFSDIYSYSGQSNPFYSSDSDRNNITNLTSITPSSSIAVYLSRGDYNNFTNSSATSAGYAVYFGTDASYNNFTNFIANSTASTAIYLSWGGSNSFQYSNYNTFINLTAIGKRGIYSIVASYNHFFNSTITALGTSTDDHAYQSEQSYYFWFINCNLTSNRGYGIYGYSDDFVINDSIITTYATATDKYATYIYWGDSGVIYNNTFISNNSGVFSLNCWGCNITRNTFINLPQTKPLVTISSYGNNTLWWNNFTQTSGYYLIDTGANTQLNSSVNGKNEGNIWYNVINTSVNITGEILSGYGNGLYLGNNGTGYPYNNVTSISKLSGNSKDYAPLTIVGSINPLVSIIYPSSSGIYSVNITQLNYSVRPDASSEALDSCWWSNDSGITKYFLQTAGLNFTEMLSIPGLNTWKVYCNDSSNDTGSAAVNFYIDVESPIFHQSNISIEYKVNFSSQLNATDDVSLNCFSINDTTNFNVNCTGYLRNNSVLNMSVYSLNISVNDSVSNNNYTVIYLNVSDTLGPIFSSYSNQTLEYGNAFAYDLNATDYNNVSCFRINDTSNFNINCTGFLRNNTILNLGLYWINITANDTLNHDNSSNIRINVSDTVAPRISTVGFTNNTNTTDVGLDINYNVSDLLLSSCWYSNDTLSVNTTLSNCNNLTSIVWTEGQHNVTIWANDSSGNTNKTTIRFFTDLTPPLFSSYSNVSSYYGSNFVYDFNATDSVNVSCFGINDTTNFNITCAGIIVNKTALAIGNYSLNVSVNDSVGNFNYTSFLVQVIARPYINLQLLSPMSNINVSQNSTFDVSVNVSCSNADCGAINVSLDPAVAGGTTVELFAGNTSSTWGSGSSTYADPINTWYHDVRLQSVYLASELRAAGIPAGASIRQLYLNISQLPGATTLANFRIRMNLTTSNTTSAVVTSWNTTAYGPTSIAKTSFSANQLLEFNFTNNFTWDGTSNILIDFSRDDSSYASGGGLYVISGLTSGRSRGGASDSGYTWPFDSMVSTAYTVVPKIWLTYVPSSSTKGGLVSTLSSATPFYTTTANPYNLTLNTGESQIITWTVNATGSNNTYLFYVYANKTSDQTINNQTSSWNTSLLYDPAVYPQFSNYYDNNASLTNSGIGLFNITLNNTNGTVYLEINNTNVTATNLSGNIFNVSYSFASNGTYSYKWHSWSNGSSVNYNYSSTRSYFVNYSDVISPTVGINSPINNYSNDSNYFVNITFSCFAIDNYRLANISLYLSDYQNSSFSLNSTSNISGTSNTSNFTFRLKKGVYSWSCRASDFGGREDNEENRTLNLNFSDSDDDQIGDGLDRLYGNKTSVSTSGFNLINITIGGNDTLETFDNVQEVVIYDSSKKILNFTYNFTSNELNLSKVKIIKETNSVIINLSGQLQNNYNKTVYIDDNNFVSLCVKDAEISSISEISSSCTGTNETDFTSCIGSASGITINGITCVDEGSLIRVENLKHSAIKGTVISTSSSTSTSSSSSGTSAGGSYIKEYSSPENYLKLKTFTSEKGVILDKIKDNKHTGIKEIEIKTKNWLTGEIYVEAFDTVPDYCKIEFKGDYKTFKVINFNSSLSDDKIKDTRIRVGILKDWIYENNVSEIKAIKCYPEYGELKINYLNETDEEGIYDVYSNGFSTWVILGTLENSDSKLIAPKNNFEFNINKKLILIVFLLVLIILILLLPKPRLNLHENLKINNKLFKLDWKFNLKFKNKK